MILKCKFRNLNPQLNMHHQVLKHVLIIYWNILIILKMALVIFKAVTAHNHRFIL
jgi:hypothetical protein